MSASPPLGTEPFRITPPPTNVMGGQVASPISNGSSPAASGHSQALASLDYSSQRLGNAQAASPPNGLTTMSFPEHSPVFGPLSPLTTTQPLMTMPTTGGPPPVPARPFQTLSQGLVKSEASSSAGPSTSAFSSMTPLDRTISTGMGMKNSNEAETLTSTERAPRPPNAWILYRSDKIRAYTKGGTLPGMEAFIEARQSQSKDQSPNAEGAEDGHSRRNLPQADISRLIAQAWKSETPEVKARYDHLANVRKLEVSPEVIDDHISLQICR